MVCVSPDINWPPLPVVRVASQAAEGGLRGDTDESGSRAYVETSVNLQGTSPWPQKDV